MLDQSGAIRPDGPAFSSLAAHAATYSPEKRLALVPASVQRIFTAAGCWSPGVRLAHDQIRLCMHACDAKAYVLPGLYPAPGTSGDLDLTVEIYGEDGRELGTRAQHRLSSSQVLLAPGLIAQALLKHLGIELSERGDLDRAIFHYREAVRILRWNGQYRFNLGEAYVRKGEIDRAIEALRRVLGGRRR